MASDEFFMWELITTMVIFLIMILGGILIFLLYKNKKAKLEVESSYTNNERKKSSGKGDEKSQGRLSIKKFMEFDDIVDNMIVRKNRQQYVMVIKCKGINYDLL